MVHSFRLSFVYPALSVATLFFGSSLAEFHTVTFVNKCGFGTPVLIQGAKTLSNGPSYTSSGPLSSAIAYLQTGKCLFNGEGCTLLEMTLGNPTVPGSGSSVDLSLIPPHAFSVPTSFAFTNGCDGSGAACDSDSCRMAFRVPDDNWAQVACQANNVGLTVTFCDGTTPINNTPPASPKAAPAPAQVQKPAGGGSTSPAKPAASNTTKPATGPACRIKRRRFTRRSSLSSF